MQNFNHCVSVCKTWAEVYKNCPIKEQNSKQKTNAARRLTKLYVNGAVDYINVDYINFETSPRGRFCAFFGGEYPNIFGDLFIMADMLIDAETMPPLLNEFRRRYLHTVGQLAGIVRAALGVKLEG